MSTAPIIHIFKDRMALADRLSRDIKDYLLRLADEKDLIYVALSGGSTPTMLFRRLAEIGNTIPWERIRIFWVDERCVPPDHADSNFATAKAELLDPLSVPESSVYRIRGEEDPILEAARYSELIIDLVSPEMLFPVFDLVLLGMGSDGHTASIFPHEIDLWNVEELCTVGRHPSGQLRVTFTGHLINGARKVIFLVAGKEKSDVLYQLLKKEEGSARYPAALVSPYNGMLEWYLDAEAAERVK